MHEIILHHYDMSPYAYKVRLMLGLKGLPWRSVHIPVVMPKPELTELTGGYRRTPVLQIGADVYCDTKMCARILEQLQPEPSLFPGGDEATVWGLSRWVETSFMMAVTVFLGSSDVFDEAFIEDRKQMAPDVDFSRAPLIVPAKLLQLRSNLEVLESQLADGRPYLLGDAVSLADLSAFHIQAFLSREPVTAELLAPLGRLQAWGDRMETIRASDPVELEAADAIEIARDATPAAALGPAAQLPDGLAEGDPVIVLPEETGSGAVAGELIGTNVHEIAIRRHSERAGEVVVHFPREDYLVIRGR